MTEEPGAPESSDDTATSEDGAPGDSELRTQIRAPERRSAGQLWLISYSDFMTILMIFFLSMYGYTYLAKIELLKKQNAATQRTEFQRVMDRLHEKLGDAITFDEDPRRIRVRLADRLLFRSGSAALGPDSGPTLDELAKSVTLVPGEVIVEGHTDNVPVTGGRFRSNWELSAARAFSVIDALTRRGIEPGRLAAWGFGENRPVASNDDAAGRAQNRRIEITILKPHGAVPG